MLQFKSQIYYITILRMKELWYIKKYYIYFNILTYKIITHSNNALNDIFEKISKLDIDEKHLLRLGQGESVLKLGKSYSKSGRIDYMLNKRI